MAATPTVKPRGILIAGNWKMNHGPQDAKAFFSRLSGQVGFAESRLRAVIFPSFVTLETAQKYSKNLPFPVDVGAQNGHWEPKGAFTGEVSGTFLKELDIQWVLIGHSERRHLFGETEDIIRQRTQGLLRQGFNVVLCVGETQLERQSSHTESVLTRQLSAALTAGVETRSPISYDRLVIAYEPVWAIGTGLTASSDQIESAHRFIRDWLLKNLGQSAAERTPILYGGSVTADNIQSILECPNVDGGLVGGASLKADVYFELVRSGLRVLNSRA